jgi:hypothetical protein
MISDVLQCMVGKKVQIVATAFAEVTICFDDGSRVTFAAQGNTGVELEATTTMFVTNTFTIDK